MRGCRRLLVLAVDYVLTHDAATSCFGAKPCMQMSPVLGGEALHADVARADSYRIVTICNIFKYIV